MILTLTASIMYWSLQQPAGSSEQAESVAEASEVSADDAASQNGEDRSSVAESMSNLAVVDDAASDITIGE